METREEEEAEEEFELLLLLLAPPPPPCGTPRHCAAPGQGNSGASVSFVERQ